jgi:hypothetical protein
MSEPADHPESAVIYLANATQCASGLTGPGYGTVPWDEAKVLVGQGLAIYGSLPPQNHEGTHGPARSSS